LFLYNSISFFKLISFLDSSKIKFFKKQLQKESLRVDEQFIVLNYPELFNNSEEISLFFQQKADQLYIWIFEDEKIFLPKSYLLAKVLKDGIYLISLKKAQVVIIVQNHQVMEEIFKPNFLSHELNILAYKYSLPLIELSNKQYNEYFEQSKKLFSFSDILYLFVIHTKKAKLKSNLASLFLLPFFIATIFLSIYIEGKSYYLEKQYKNIKSQYQQVKSKNKELLDLKQKNSNILALHNKTKEVLNKKDIVRYYIELASLVDANTTFRFVRYNYEHFSLRVETNNSVSLVESLENSPFFKNVKLSSSNKFSTLIEGDIDE